MEERNNNFPADLANVGAKWINDVAKEEGEKYAKKIRTNQLRNFFSLVNSIKINFRNKTKSIEEIKDGLILLKPKLAYAKGKKGEVEPFQKFMFDAIDAVVNSSNPQKALENFFSLVEAIIAYHKYFGGKDN